METTPTPDLENTRYPLEENQLFSQSILWDLQKRYFASKGADAWRGDGVPDYITSNPMIANAYAELVFAFWLDQNRISIGRDNRQALHLIELGAGPGRFAFHFLCRLMRLCEQTGVPPQSFRYVLTDQAESNLEFWRNHPNFQPFFSNGLLDVATLDMSSPADVRLQVSGGTITRGSLDKPLVVIANYAFDSIPQELLYFNEGACHRCLFSIFLAQPAAPELDVSQILPRLQYHYSHELSPMAPYEEPWLQNLVASYQKELKDTHLLFPAVGLRCIQWLRELSREGLLLVSADKGEHRLEEMRGDDPPELVLDDNCFALDVNFHAIKVFCESSGGLALVPQDYQDELQISCCLMVKGPQHHIETRRAYQRHVLDFSPVDFFHIIFQAEQTIGKMSPEEVLAYFRLSCYDSIQLERCLPRLVELAPQLNSDERAAVKDAIERVWNSYFPMDKEFDMADEIARLLYTMGEYEPALIYFSRSVESFGPNTGSLYNIASCHLMLGQPSLAEPLLMRVLEEHPGHEQASKLLEENRQSRAVEDK
jgi:tetratricopeptide (TPR) repeat protein